MKSSNPSFNIVTEPVPSSLRSRPLAKCQRTLSLLLAVFSTAIMLGGTAKAATIKKFTKFENLAANPTPVKNGRNLVLTAQLTYRDKVKNWGYLGYTTANVTLTVIGRPDLSRSGMTDRRNGVVTFIIPAKYAKIPTNGMRVKWIVKFAGSSELAPDGSSSFFSVVN